MYNNICLLRFGLNPNDFVDKPIEIIQNDNEIIYLIEQKIPDRFCEKCGCDGAIVKGYYYTEITVTQNSNLKEIVRIKRVRLKCKKCGCSYSPKLTGIESYCKISDQVVRMICNDLGTTLTYDQIAKKYGVTSQTVVNIFDEKIGYMRRGKMPRVLCIDEIRFTSSDFSKFACIISDFETRTIIDICFSRRLDYLNQYFSEIPLKERENVQIFISDMYDGYATVCKKFFPKAIHIVDLFHVVSLLTTTINMIRNRVQNLYLEKGTPEYNFMSTHWRFFVSRYDKIPSLFYKHKKTNVCYEYANIFKKCLEINSTLCEGYNILQELLNYSDYYTFDEALDFINRIVNKLNLTGNELLEKVAKSFHKWRFEIANGFNKRKLNFSYSNAVAENLNNHIKTLIKSSYGLRNPERMRKRILYIEQRKKA